MRAFLLYGLTAGITGWDLLYLLVRSAWGAPVHVLEYVAGIGAILLLISAYLSLWKRRIAAQLALAAALAEWAFYLPALRTTGVRTVGALSTQAGILAILAMFSLLIVTLYAAAATFRSEKTQIGTNLPTRRSKKIVLGGTALLIVMTVPALAFIGRRQAPQPFDVVLPDNYHGWVRIDFGYPGAPPLGTEGRNLLVRVPPTGVVETSTQLVKNGIENRYRFANQTAQPVVSKAFLVQKTSAAGDARNSEYIFVGPLGLHSGQQPGPMVMPIQHGSAE